MTTKTRKLTQKLPYRILSDIDYDALEFNVDEFDIGPDRMLQLPSIAQILQIMDYYLDTNYPPEEVFRSANTFICYDPADRNVRVSPYWYVAFGVDAPAITRRRIYLPDEVGKPPDMVLEVASDSTARQDIRDKPGIYARVGVPEYWRFDATGGDLYGYPLAGDLLVSGAYQPLELDTAPDGILKGYSPALGLALAWQDGLLRLYDPETGAYLKDLRQTTEELRAEQAARRAAEQRVRQLEEELRRRQ